MENLYVTLWFVAIRLFTIYIDCYFHFVCCMHTHTECGRKWKRESELARERQRECVWVSFYMCWLDAKEVWVSSAFVRVLVLERERNRGRREGVDKWGRVGKSEMPSTLSRRSIRPIAFSVLIIFFSLVLNVRLNRHSLWRKNNYRFQEGILYIYRRENGTATTQHTEQKMKCACVCVCVCVFEICMWTRAKDFHSKWQRGQRNLKKRCSAIRRAEKNRTMSNNKIREA